jgi:hypothetical protein
MLCSEIALKQGWGNVYALGTHHRAKKIGRLNMGWTVMRRHWLDYDLVALAVLIVGVGLVELLVLSI